MVGTSGGSVTPFTFYVGGWSRVSPTENLGSCGTPERVTTQERIHSRVVRLGSCGSECGLLLNVPGHPWTTVGDVRLL